MTLGKRKWIALILGSSLFVGACATVAVVTREDDTAVAQEDEDNPLLEATTSTAAETTTTAAATTTVPAPEPSFVAEAPPANPHAPSPIIDIGAIRIPAIGLEHRLYEGVTLTVINRGPGHWPGTAMPGQVGNTVFPGHRTTYSHPFGDLDKLKPGDAVIFDMPEAVYEYHVVETIIVAPTDLWVVDQGTTPTFTLVACHPKGSARQRIVVKGDLAGTFPK